MFLADTSGSDLPKLKDFKPLKFLGKGAYSTVYLVRKNGGMDDGTLYAMKTLPVSRDEYENSKPKRYFAEQNVLERLTESPFVVRLHYVFQTQSSLYLTLDYYPAGDLAGLIYKMGHLTESDAQLYLAEIALGIQHLHENGIIHRDIKPGNILFDACGHVAIADFGVSAYFTSNTVKIAFDKAGTKQYMAPEMIKRSGYSFEVDWWSLGIIAYVMMTGHKPFVFENNDVPSLHRQILEKEPRFPMHVTSKAKNFIESLLKKNPSKRLGGLTGSPLDIKKDPFFKKIDWERVARKEIKMPPLPQVNSDNNNDLVEQDSSLVGLFENSYNEVCTYVAPAHKTK
ncbi:ribosomal protein S6 kinase alpha-5-like isoform X2 [Zootermopsis nevadensis]|uniref:ribosomal protein S6 kinase alpha-5-like isoform X2 n=1 Tax=Zootermopsis nevadensis TaxID=136037 RepID=UPI000B8EC1F4|nr:ribosomal protein S6 kinase alpha-5-like isoform X2 [Zootermopsis nevadensis]